MSFPTVGPVQKCLTRLGYTLNFAARQSVRDIEWLNRKGNGGRQRELCERIKRVVSAAISILVAAILILPSSLCYLSASCLGKGRFEWTQSQNLPELCGREIKVMSLNVCFQDPWSPLTGGVVTPMEPVGIYSSRVAAIADAVAKESPDVFVGQEFESLGAQEEFIRLLKKRADFGSFIRDLGSNDPISNNSGLFVASKSPLKGINFVPFPIKDRAGLAKWSNQGALAIDVSLGERMLRIVNTHLNYGGGEADQTARNRQLHNHVLPLFNENIPTVLLGDLNFDTSTDQSALAGYVNALEGQVTCSDSGKHQLRGKSVSPSESPGSPCEDCAERIDGLVYKQKGDVKVKSFVVRPLALRGQPLSDHYATIATLKIK